MSKSLHLYLNDNWIQVKDKKAFYKTISYGELKRLVKLQKVYLTVAGDDVSKNRLTNSVKKLNRQIRLVT